MSSGELLNCVHNDDDCKCSTDRTRAADVSFKATKNARIMKKR